MHIFDSCFALAPKARRKESDATVTQYRDVQTRLGLSRLVVVQPTAYGRDNRCTLDAMAQLGAMGDGDSARGVAVIDDTISDAEIERLHQAGMRGVRFRMPSMVPRAANRTTRCNWKCCWIGCRMRQRAIGCWRQIPLRFMDLRKLLSLSISRRLTAGRVMHGCDNAAANVSNKLQEIRGGVT
jgi:hypothetical protein